MALPIFNALAAGISFIAPKLLKIARVACGGIMQQFFEVAVEMMRQVCDKLTDKIVGSLEGSAHFFRKKGDVFQEGTKNYSIDDELGEWHETVVTRSVKQEAVPESYLPDMFAGEEYNDTGELKNSLVY